MEGFKVFLANNYFWFLGLAVLFIFALLGYLMDAKKRKSEEIKTESLETIKANEKVEELKVEENTSTNAPTEELTSEILEEPKEESHAEEIKEETQIIEEPKAEEPKTEIPKEVKKEEVEVMEDVTVTDEKKEETIAANNQVESLIQEETSDESTFQG